jgi:hypothetical protein
MFDAADHYDRARPGLGDEYLTAVDEAVVLVAEAPARWPRINGRHHRFVMQRFPFSVVYRFDDRELIIVAVAHHKRRPGYWSERG